MPREDFQRELEDLNPDTAAAIKKVVEQEMQLNKRRGPLHPSTPEEIEQANQVCCQNVLHAVTYDTQVTSWVATVLLSTDGLTAFCYTLYTVLLSTNLRWQCGMLH